jgi:hypothetical protein
MNTELQLSLEGKGKSMKTPAHSINQGGDPLSA